MRYTTLQFWEIKLEFREIKSQLWEINADSGAINSELGEMGILRYIYSHNYEKLGHICEK